jgi:hypothetical protein
MHLLVLLLLHLLVLLLLYLLILLLLYLLVLLVLGFGHEVTNLRLSQSLFYFGEPVTRLIYIFKYIQEEKKFLFLIYMYSNAVIFCTIMNIPGRSG